jgi:DNA-binding GntR family transcriptional regulator
LIDTIVDLLREQRRILSLIDGAVHGQYHHRRILEAVAAHDAAGARERMQAHLHQIREDGLAVSP